MSDDTMEFLAAQDGGESEQEPEPKTDICGFFLGDSQYCQKPATWVVINQRNKRLAVSCDKHVSVFRNLKAKLKIFENVRILPLTD